MQLKTILNHVTNYKPFVIDSEKFSDDQETIEVTMRARSNSKSRCNCFDLLPSEFY